jgi:glycine dehydrogenase subunit 2
MIRKVRPTSRRTSRCCSSAAPGKLGLPVPRSGRARGGPRRHPRRRQRPREIEGFPEVSEVEAIRHFTRLSTWNYAIDHGMYPARLLHHEVQPAHQRAGGAHRRPGLGASLPARVALAGRHGSDGAPGSRARRDLRHGRGDAAARRRRARRAHRHPADPRLLEKRGNPRKKILIPDSAHGTNPATAAIAGYAVENIPSSEPACWTSRRWSSSSTATWPRSW